MKTIKRAFYTLLTMVLLSACLTGGRLHAEPDDQTAQSTSTDSGKKAEALSITVSNSSGNLTDLTDDMYSTYVSVNATDPVTIKADQNIYGIYIEWYKVPGEWDLENGSESIKCGTNGFLHEFVKLDGSSNSCTMNLRSNEAICNISAYSEGQLPDDVQVWEPVCEKADLLVYSTHADDEILFLGGALATYAGEQGLSAEVVYMTNYWNAAIIREHEKLDGLWVVGVRNYPVVGPFEDLYATSLEGAKTVYNYDEVVGWTTEMARRFKPQVVITQDFNGEYGHGGHILLANAVAEAVDNANDASFHPESADKYGTWDVPKAYFHLYETNLITLDLRQPLSKFGGQTAVEVASSAYKRHESQQWCWFYVSDDPNDPKAGQINCSLFGLYRSTVGEDTGNDMLEHITTYEEIARQEEEARIASEQEAARKAAEEVAAREEAEKKASTEEAAKKEAKKSSALKIIIIVIVVIVVLVLAVAGFMYYNAEQERKRQLERKRRQQARRRRESDRYLDEGGSRGSGSDRNRGSGSDRSRGSGSDHSRGSSSDYSRGSGVSRSNGSRGGSGSGRSERRSDNDDRRRASSNRASGRDTERGRTSSGRDTERGRTSSGRRYDDRDRRSDDRSRSSDDRGGRSSDRDGRR